MLVVTYSEARQTFASILDRAGSEGGVLITRQDGSVFRLSPEPIRNSPFSEVIPLSPLPPGELSAALGDMKERWDRTPGFKEL